MQVHKVHTCAKRENPATLAVKGGGGETSSSSSSPTKHVPPGLTGMDGARTGRVLASQSRLQKGLHPILHTSVLCPGYPVYSTYTIQLWASAVAAGGGANKLMKQRAAGKGSTSGTRQELVAGDPGDSGGADRCRSDASYDGYEGTTPWSLYTNTIRGRPRQGLGPGPGGMDGRSNKEQKRVAFGRGNTEEIYQHWDLGFVAWNGKHGLLA